MKSTERSVAEFQALQLVKTFYQLLDADDHHGAIDLLHADIVWFRQGILTTGIEAVRNAMQTRQDGVRIRRLVMNDTAYARTPTDIQCSY